MKRLVLAGIGFGLLATSASAADLGYRRSQSFSAPPVATMPTFTWTGFYLGANAGWSGGSSRANFPSAFTADSSGLIAGLQAGYNYQMDRVILGVETDLNYLQNSLSRSFVSGAGTAISLKRDNGWIGTTRARIGFTPVERFMVYGTGGLAYGNSDVAANVVAPTTAAWAGKASDTKFGWTVGAGSEYAFTNNISVKGEYLYYNLGSTSTTLTPGNAAAAGVSPVLNVENRGHILRAGVNYKF